MRRIVRGDLGFTAIGHKRAILHEVPILAVNPGDPVMVKTAQESRLVSRIAPTKTQFRHALDTL